MDLFFRIFNQFLLKRMLLVLHNVVFIENKAALLGVIMTERARAFTIIIYYITF